MPAVRSASTRVLLACSGLDHAHRGFESFAREAFDVLRHEPEIEMALVKGSGPPADAERSIPTLTRDTALAKWLGWAWGREPFRVEQVAFGLSLLPVIARRRPEVVYFSEWHTGLVLGAFRRATRGPFRLILCNGTMAVTGFGHLDRVQQLTPAAREAALAHGDDPDRHVLLPLGFTVAPALGQPGAEEQAALRRRLGLPSDRPVVLTLAAMNRHHKRLDYLIEEVARLPQPRPFLLMAGEPEAETEGLRSLAAARLGTEGHSFRTVGRAEVGSLLAASDVFVLASLGEGLPRALIEALAAGLPCLAHDYPVARYALGPTGELSDFTVPGSLSQLLQAAITRGFDPAAAARRHAFAYENFSWDRLSSRYVELLRGKL